MRKPIEGIHHSIESFYYDIFKDFKSKKIEIVFKNCPLISKGILNRIFMHFILLTRAQSINFGDINFISIFMNKNN